MLNFRKLKQDFSSNLLQEGKQLHEQKKILSAKIVKLDNDSIRFSAKVMGNFDNAYESELEIDRFESETIHSNCDCSYRYDCQHLAALVFYLEEHLNSLLVSYSKETDIDKDESFGKEEKKDLIKKIKQAEHKEEVKKDANFQKQVLHEYISAADVLSGSSFFLPKEDTKISMAEFALVFNPQSFVDKKNGFVEISLALRLPSRSKPLNVPNIKEFLESIRYEEPIYIGGKKYFFTFQSFGEIEREIIKVLMDHVHFTEVQNINDRSYRVAKLDFEIFGMILAVVHEMAMKNNPSRSLADLSEDLPVLPCIFSNNLETPLNYSFANAQLRFELEHLKGASEKLFLKPTIVVDQNGIDVDQALLFECSQTGMLFQDVYYRFANSIKRAHLRQLSSIREMTIPHPLFGTFVENALPELKRFAEVSNLDVLEKFVTLPFAKNLEARCSLSFLDGELEATLFFSYDGNEIRSSATSVTYDNISNFVSNEGILARDLVLERKIVDDIFQDFLFNPQSGTYITKSEKKIVEFMTEIIPRYQDSIKFECPQNLLDQFIYDKTKFKLKLDCSKPGFYNVNLKVNGDLKGVKFDLLWECVASRRAFIELATVRKGVDSGQFSKILVLDLEKISKVVNLFDEIGIKKLIDHIEERPIWSLVTINEDSFKNLPVDFEMSKELKEIQKEMLGQKEFKPSAMPKVSATLRSYQEEGVHWLERLRCMYLNGILADDMGLGKTLQAILAITQYNLKNKGTSIVVCPTTLLYNWQEEFHKFNPLLKTTVIDGVPLQRKKLIENAKNYDVIITSYTLMQKDIEQYKDFCFAYAILDEAQHIKNRGTRNAKSVKMIQSLHKLILTGTPIENSLSEIWSLFDFLMPGFLSTYERFAENFVRTSGEVHHKNVEYLKKKVTPFILRRMKGDVLSELPPVSEISYHCQLSGPQLDLYRSYAKSAKDELTKMVAKEGFDKVQIHVLATLTRLKQICCHPAIFAKDNVEVGDSAKYEMLLELVQNLIESNHKTVIFSQYTKMLQIMLSDFKQRGYNFSYLDGSTKNRLQIVKEFNENDSIPLFLVSLKAGGTGLNITGADTVIHYDMWWNPAVENQATDRVHRIGQKKSVSSYKLITLNSIEEKIVEMQNRKKGLVKKVVSSDDEAISKLTWEEVLELLQA
ncbi:MAG: SNF2 helicase associated domain-containing protein [Chlamydiae bacterium]|nr:SNF2 helicase associated domain-containing protein [Chlamydiota bacterium]